MSKMELDRLKGVRVLTHGGVTWLDVESPDASVFEALEKAYGLHQVQLQESVQKVQLSEVEREGNYVFALLPAPYFNEAKHKLATGQLGIFLGKDYLLTVHDKSTKLSSEVFAECLRSSSLRDDYFRKGPGSTLYHLIRRLLEQLSDLEQRVLGELDSIEDKVFDDSASDAFKIGHLRQKISRLKRIVFPLTELLSDLSTDIDVFTGHSLQRHFANNTKIASRLAESIEGAKETIEIYKDADFTISTEKTNETLAILTLLFTLTIPATVVSGLYGMNVLLPGGIEAGSWTFFGKYTMFKLVLSASALLALGMYAYFKRKKWF
jgi:magnesium transporter